MDVMTRDFEDLCREKYDRGIKEHRNGDATAPFKGEILKEVCEELADIPNYLREDMATVGDEDWSAEIAFCRQFAEKVRAVYFRRLGQ